MQMSEVEESNRFDCIYDTLTAYATYSADAFPNAMLAESPSQDSITITDQNCAKRLLGPEPEP